MTDLIPRDAALSLPHRLSPSLDAADGYYVSVDAIRAIPTVDPAAIREAARLMLSDLARALDTDMAADGIEAGKRWSAVSDAMEAAPTAMDRPTPIQMIRAGLQRLALIGEKK